MVGASLLLSARWGEYHGHHLVNAGANRWMVRPGLGMSLRRGSWRLDLMGSVKLFEDNGDYFGGSRLEREPLYAVQGHVTYQFRGGNWLSLNANFYRGGETTVDGVEKDDYVSNSRWGVTLALPLNARHSLKLNASTGVITRVGSDFDTLGAAWQYRF